MQLIELTPQPSINDVRSNALAKLVARLGALDLTKLLVYRIDSAPDSALVPLLWQFDMLDPEWIVGVGTLESTANIDPSQLTNTGTMQSPGSAAGPSDYDTLRILIKASIPLHSVMGVPETLIDALENIGWSGATLLEGQASWGGSFWPPNEAPFVFRVIINLTAGQTVGPDDITRIIAAANFFKPLSRWLDAVIFNGYPLADSAPAPTDFISGFGNTRPAGIDAVPAPADHITANATPVADTIAVAPYYNDHYYHAGITHGAPNRPVADSGVIDPHGTIVSPQY